MLRVQNKEKNTERCPEKHQVNYKGKPIRVTADLSSETLKARREHRLMYFKSKTK
jgi:hypothetical protein